MLGVLLQFFRHFLNMSSGPATQAAFIQGNQSTIEHDASHSALFYLFQEVSKLASPIHNSFLDTNPPSTWLHETSRQGPFMVKKEEEDAHPFQLSNSSCQHGLARVSMKKGKEESHGGKVATLVEPHPKCNSPWKVLSLINLQCERLLHQRDVEESDPCSLSSSTKSSTAIADVTEQRVCTLRPSLLIYERQEIPACVGFVEDVRGDCSRGKADTVSVLSVKRQFEWNKGCKRGCLSSKQDILSSENVSPQTHIPDASLNAQLTISSSVALSKPALTLDHNSNLVLTTEPPCDTQLPPPCSFVLVKHNDTNTASKPECTHAHIEENCPLVAQSYKGATSPSATQNPELRPVQKEEIAAPSTQQWGNKTPRKQPHPRRSADIQDPDFQGVTFRMDTELDDNREQCRLLITSKYSMELRKSVRKRRVRTRTSQKSLKSSSSDEESYLTTSVSKGKVCASCCTRKTPMWRDAEDGTPLCNACGIRYKKYRVRCVNCWHIPRKEGNSNSCCLKCGNFVRLTSAQRKHTA